MATPTIPNGEEQFFPIIYEGNGAGQRVGKFVPFTDNGTIANSVIFNDDDSPRLYRQISAGNRKTWTISCWFKLGKTPSTDSAGFWVSSPSDDGGVGGNPSPYNMIFFQFASGQLEIQDYQNPSYVIRLKTNRTFEDTSKFYHLLLAVDTTQSTTANRVRMYIDGDEITSFATSTYPSLNADTNANRSGYYDVINVGYNQYWDGYLAEFNFVDGQALTPASFGVTDTSTGRWIPKALTGITYGTNGFRLTFADSSAFGDDTSGNTNDFTATNLATTDQTTDSPTQNFATFSPSFSSSTMGLTEGNLTVTDNGGTSWETAFVGKPVQSGKWYFEATVDVAGTYDTWFGVNTLDSLVANKSTYSGYADGSAGFQPYSGGDVVYHGNNGSNNYQPGSSTSFTNGDKIGVAYDADTGAFWASKNNTWINSGNPSTGANPLFSGITAQQLVYFSLTNATNGTKHSVNFGQKSFTYTPPTGFVALQQDNLPETAKGVSGFTWLKDRDNATNHYLVDSSRNYKNALYSNGTDAEVFLTAGLRNPLKGGFEVLDGDPVNGSGRSFVSWNWVANGGTTASNTDGDISSTVQVNTTAGFSIVQYTGNGSSNQSIGHGLGVIPRWIIVKELSSTDSWNVWHGEFANTEKILLNDSGAKITGSTAFGSYTPTSSLFKVNGNNTNASSATYVAYCWNEVFGYSKFGDYTGNGSTDGPFVYTGFKPSFLIIKCTTHANNWVMYNNKMNPFNPVGENLGTLFPNRTNAAETQGGIDFCANGFKARSTYENFNGSGRTYIYMSFAEHPFVGDGTSPVTAR